MDDWHDGDLYMYLPDSDFSEYVGEDIKLKLIEVYGGLNRPLFELLANVNSGMMIDAYAEPRGIPFDTNETIRNVYKNGEFSHSASYFTLRELMHILDIANDRAKLEDGEDYAFAVEGLESIITNLKARVAMIWPYVDNMERNWENIRVVFWFA